MSTRTNDHGQFVPRTRVPICLLRCGRFFVRVVFDVACARHRVPFGPVARMRGSPIPSGAVCLTVGRCAFSSLSRAGRAPFSRMTFMHHFGLVWLDHMYLADRL
eukprot:7164178-Pyramimonas_sp.AAC.1